MKKGSNGDVNTHLHMIQYWNRRYGNARGTMPASFFKLRGTNAMEVATILRSTD